MASRALAFAVLLAGCGRDPGTVSTSDSRSDAAASSCATLAQRYAAAVPAARVCDPAFADACSGTGPMVVAEVPSGTTTSTFDPSMIQGLSLCPCGIPMNPERMWEVDAALDAFHAAGCSLMPTPGCCLASLDPSRSSDSPPAAVCEPLGDGTGVCSDGTR